MGVQVFLLALPPEIVDELEDCILADNLEADIDVEENSSLLHDQSSVEAWPDFDLVGVQRVSLSDVEAFPADGLKSQASHE